MKILIDLTSLADNFSGIERYALSITQELIDHEENDYILVFKKEIHKAFVETPYNVRKVVIAKVSKLVAAQVLLPLKLWCIKADVYFFPAFPAPFFFFSRTAVTTIHDMGSWDCPDTDKSWMSLYFRILYRKAAMCGKRIVTVSEFSKNRIVDLLRVKPEKICITYNGLSELFLDAKHNEYENAKVTDKYNLPEKYILCLSTIEPRKNMRLLIDAYAELFTEGKLQLDLVLAGRKGWMVENLLANLSEDVMEHIHFTGFVDNEDLSYVYRSAQYFVFPSLYEGFGIPPLEAMSQGSIVLASDAASIPEVLGDAAIYFENNNVEDLKKQILNVTKMSEEEKSKLRMQGKQHAKAFQWGTAAEKLLAFWEEDMV